MKCVVCGGSREEKDMIMRRLNGVHHFCCVKCEAKWEKQNLVGVCG
ncbi:MAG TPA: hypothetical protein VNX25_08075 [Verrucomicrobiae bacterium]|nr:hypothetical protein [Verrucomicrobiae bacterium]